MIQSCQPSVFCTQVPCEQQKCFVARATSRGFHWDCVGLGAGGNLDVSTPRSWLRATPCRHGCTTADTTARLGHARSPPCLWLHCDQQHVLMAKSHTRGAGVLLVGQGKLCVLVIKRERQSMTRNKKCSPGKCVQQEIQAAVVPGTPKF